MLQLLEDHLRKHSFYHEVELGKVPYSACTSSAIKVLDFDKIKDQYFQVLGSYKMKSVDVLYLKKEKDLMYFIEMKSTALTGPSDCKKFIKRHFGKYGITNKIMDSVCVLLGIMGLYKIDDTFYSYFYNPQKLTIKTFLLTNLSSSDLISLDLATLSKQRIGLTKRIEGDTLITNCSFFEKHLSSL